MDRRQFLGVAAGSVAGAGAIGWLGYHFLGARGPALADVWRTALRIGKPVLVLVIPEQKHEKYERGHLFGELLNYGGPGVYLDLALCELSCATVTGAREQFGGVPGEPLMLLVETDDPKPRATAIDPEISYDCPDFWADHHDNGAEIDRFLRNRMDVVAAALRQCILPNRATLAERAKFAEARLPADESKRLRAALADGTPVEPEALDRGAAIVRSVAENPEARMPQVLRALAAAAARRVTGAAPAGATWARADACGTTIEGEHDDRNWACGMGHVPELSERFLWFFTK